MFPSAGSVYNIDYFLSLPSSSETGTSQNNKLYICRRKLLYCASYKRSPLKKLWIMDIMCIRVFVYLCVCGGGLNNALIYLLYRPIHYTGYVYQQHIAHYKIQSLADGAKQFKNLSSNAKRLVVRMPYLTSTCRPKEICTR